MDKVKDEINMMKYYLDDFGKKSEDYILIKSRFKEDAKKMCDVIEKIEYDEEDYIKNYFNYWRKNKFFNLKEHKFFYNVELDKLWYLNRKNKFEENKNKSKDINDLCKDKNLHVDTMFSMWSYFVLVLNHIKPEEKYRYYNKRKIVMDEIELEKAINIIKSDNKIYKELNELAKAASLDINVITYPTKPNKKINFNTYRGTCFYDQFLFSLGQCFEKGYFSCLFENEEELKNWIESNKLEDFFAEKNDYNYNNIISIGKYIKKQEILNVNTKVEYDVLLDIIKSTKGFLEKRK